MAGSNLLLIVGQSGQLLQVRFDHEAARRWSCEVTFDRLAATGVGRTRGTALEAALDTLYRFAREREAAH